MSEPFATVEDLTVLFRTLTPAETERAKVLLPIISDTLREEAHKVGKDLDEMIVERASFASVVKSVTVDVAGRCLMTPTDGTPMTQQSQSALGYSISGTFLVPGGGLFIKNSELARLGLRRQQVGVFNPYAKRNPCHPFGEDQNGP